MSKSLCNSSTFWGVGFVIAIVVTFAGTWLFCDHVHDAAIKIEQHNAQLINAVKFQQVFELSRGFYKDCSFIVEKRENYGYFSGTIAKCTSNPDVILSPVELNIEDFIDGLQKN